MHKVVESFWIKATYFLKEKLPQSIKACRFVLHRAIMSGEFDSRKDSQSTKFKRRPWKFIKLTFRELCNSKLSGLHLFDNEATIIHWVKICKKWKGRLWVHKTLILEVIFLTLTGNSSVVTNDTQGSQSSPYHWK